MVNDEVVRPDFIAVGLDDVDGTIVDIPGTDETIILDEDTIVEDLELEEE